MTVSSPATQARTAAGLTLEQAAQRARVCPAYLRRIEKHGGASYVLALRLSRLYGCNMMLFLHQTAQRIQSEGGRTLSNRSRPRAATLAGNTPTPKPMIQQD